MPNNDPFAYLNEDEAKINTVDAPMDYLEQMKANPIFQYSPEKSSMPSVYDPSRKADDYDHMDHILPFGDLDEQLAQDQSNTTKVLNMFPRILTKAVGEVAKMPGYLGGLADWASTGFKADEIFRMADNAWVNAIEDAEKHVNNEWFPVYKRKAVEEGGFWREVASPEFWATDFADGLGFFASMFVPGAIIGKMGLAGKIGRAFSMPAKYARKAELLTQTAVNTVFESAAETAGTIDELKEYYAKQVADGNLTQEEANKRIGQAGVGVFNTNLAILMGPNFVQNKLVLGRLTKSSTAKSVIARAASENPEIISKAAAKREFAKRMLGSMASEGLWEEGSQTATEQYWNKKAKGETDAGIVDGLLSEYWDMLGTKEGQKSIFLGALLGSMGGGVGTLRKRMQQNEQVANLNELLERNFEGFTANLADFYEREGEDGPIKVDEQGRPVKNPEKFIETLNNLFMGEAENAVLDRLKEAGNETAYEEAFTHAFTRWAMPYLQHEGGAEILKKKIDDLQDIHNETVKTAQGLDTNEQATQKMKEMVDNLEKHQQRIANYTNEFYKFKSPKGERENRDEFVRLLQRSALHAYAEIDLQTQRIQDLKGEITELEQKDSSDPILAKKKADLKRAETALNNAKENKKMIFNKKEQTTAWEAYLARKDQARKRAEDAVAKDEARKKEAKTTSPEIIALRKRALEDEIVETPDGGRQLVTHHGEIKVTVTNEDGSLKPLWKKETAEKHGQFKQPREGSEENEAITYWRVEDIDNQGRMKLTDPKSGGVAWLLPDGTFEYAGNHSRFTVEISKSPTQAREESQKEAALAYVRKGMETYDERIRTSKQRIDNIKERIAKITKSIERAQVNQSGKTVVEIDGKKAALAEAELKQILKELRAEKKMYTERIRKYRTRKAELKTAQDKIQKDGFDIQNYTKRSEELQAEMDEAVGVVNDLDVLIDIIEEKIANLRKWIGGLDTQLKNAIIKNHGAEAYENGILADILNGKVLDPEVTAIFNNKLKGLEKINVKNSELADARQKSREAADVVESLQEKVNEIDRKIDRFFKEYFDIMGIKENTTKKGTPTYHEKKPANIAPEDEIPTYEERKKKYDNELDEDISEFRTPWGGIETWIRSTGNQQMLIEGKDKYGIQENWYTFMESWSRKKRHTRVLRTMTYQQAKAFPADNTARQQLRFWVPSQKDMLTVKEIEELNDPAAEAEAQEDIKIFVIDKGDKAKGTSARLVTYDGQMIYTSLPAADLNLPSGRPRFGLESKTRQRARILVNDRTSAFYGKDQRDPDVMKYAKAEVQKAVEESLEEYKEFRKEVSEKQTTLKINTRTPGKKRSHETGDVVGAIVDNDKQLFDTNLMEVYIEKKSKKDKPSVNYGGVSYSTIPGAAYIYDKHTERLNLVLQGKLSEQDRRTILKILRLLTDPNQKEADPFDLHVALKNMLYLYKTKNDEKKGPMQMHLNTALSNDDQIISVQFGDKVITAKELNDQTGPFDEFMEFLEQKYHNINDKALEKEEFTEFRVNDKDELTTTRWTKDEGGYLGYLFSKKDGRVPKARVDVADKVSRNPRERAKDPQYVNSSFIFEVDGDTTMDWKAFNEAKEKKGEETRETPPPPTEEPGEVAAKAEKETPNAFGLRVGPKYTLRAIFENTGNETPIDGVVFTIDKDGNFSVLEGNEDAFLKIINNYKKKGAKSWKAIQEMAKKHASQAGPKPFSMELTMEELEDTTEPQPAEEEMMMSEPEDTVAEAAQDEETDPDAVYQMVYDEAVKQVPGSEEFAKEIAERAKQEQIKKNKQNDVVTDQAEEQEEDEDDGTYYSGVDPTQGSIDLAAELEWIRDKFPGLPVETQATLIKNMYGGAFMKGTKVLLSEAAHAGTAYHEGWHVYSQSFLTPMERKELYNEVRKREKNPELTNAEVEEILAEEFRMFVMSNGKYKWTKNNQKQKNVFLRIWDAIKQFAQKFFGSTDKDVVHKHFVALNSGSFDIRKRKSDPARDFYRINDMSEALSQLLIKDMNAEFFRVLMYGDNGDINIDALFNTEKHMKDIYDRVKAHYQGVADSTKGRNRTAKLILDNWIGVQNAHTEFTKQFGLRLNKIAEPEDILEEDQRKDNYSYKASNLTDSKTLIPKPLAMMMAGLPVLDNSSNKLKAKELETETYYGLMTARYNDTMDLLHSNLSNITTYEGMIEKMQELSETHPEILVLLKWLGSTGGKIYADPNDEARVQLQAMFYVQFSKNKNNPVLTYVRESGNINLISAVSHTARNRMLSQWIANAKRNAAENASNSAWRVNSAGQVVFNPDVKFKIGGLMTPFKLIDVADFPKKPAKAIEVLESLGMEFTDDFKKLGSMEAIDGLISWMLNNMKDGITLEDFYDKEGLEIRKEIDDLLEKAAVYQSDMTEMQYVNQEGKIEYSVTLNTSISNTMNMLNERKVPPHLSDNLYTANSLWLRRIIDDKDHLTLHLLRGMRTERKPGDETSSVTFADYQSLIVNAVLEGYIPLMRSADRKLEYAFRFGKINAAADIDTYVKHFRGYVQDEIAATIEALSARENDPRKTMKNYSENIKKLRVFEKVVSQKALETLAKTVEDGDFENAARNYIAQNVESVDNALREMYNESVNKTIESLADSGIIKITPRKGSEPMVRVFGISTEALAQFGNFKEVDGRVLMPLSKFKKVMGSFTYHYSSGMIEQSKLFIGDFANFKNPDDVLKRVNGATSTRLNPYNSKEFNNALNVLYPRADGQKYRPVFGKKVLPEPVVDFSKDKDQKGLPAKGGIYAKYAKVEPADAQAKSTLDMHRETMLKHAKWTDAHERAYQYEIQTLYKRILNEDPDTWSEAEHHFLENAPNAFRRHTNGMQFDVPMFRGEPINMVQGLKDETILPLGVLKTQGYGPDVDVEGMFAVDFFKHSLAPIVPSTVSRGTMDYELMLEMMKDGFGVYTYPTAEKGASQPEMTMSFDHFGIQTEVHEDFQGQVVMSTQMRRMQFYDLFNNPKTDAETDVYFGKLKEEHVMLTNQLITKKRKRLLKSLGLEETAEGYQFTSEEDKKKFRDRLRSMFDERALPTNVLEGLEKVLWSDNMIFDTLVTRDKIDNVLTALVRNQVIRPKVKGELMVQETAEGYEEDLKFYQYKKGNKTITEAEVMIPLPADWMEFVARKFPADTFEESLRLFNEQIAQQNYTGIADSRFFTFTANRIPTKHIANMEVFRIKKFLPPQSGPRIVVPNGITIKSGSDFDVDKLTCYFKNYKPMKGSETPKYAELKDSDSDAAIENRLNEITEKVLMHPENYDQLMLPDSSKTLEDLAKDINKDTRGYTWKDLIEFDQMVLKAKAFWAGKSGVAVTAVHNAAHATTQQVPLNINDDALTIYFPGQKEEAGKYKVGHVFTKNGQKISDMLGEFLTAYVDVAKDPFVFHLNATFENFPVYSFLLRAGANSGNNIQEIAYFMTQDIIKDFTKMLEDNKAMFLKDNEISYEDNILDELLGKYGGPVMESLPGYHYMKAYETTDMDLREYHLKKSKELRDELGWGELSLTKLKSGSKDIQIQVLDNFLMYRTAAYQLRDFQSATRADSSFPNTVNGVREVEGRMNDVYENNFFNKEDFVKYIETTELAAFHETRKESPRMFRQFYLHKLPQVEAKLEEIRKRYAEAGTAPKDIAYIMDRFEHFFVTYVLHTTPGLSGNTTQALNADYQSLMISDNTSLAIDLVKLRKDKKLRDNALIRELHAELKEKNYRRGENVPVNMIKMATKRLMLEEQNSITTAWKELLESKNPQAREFGEKLMQLAIMESGMERSPFSLTEYIPNEEYLEMYSGPVIKNFMKDYSKKSVAEQTKYLKALEQEFYQNNWNNSTVVPNVKARYMSENDNGDLELVVSNRQKAHGVGYASVIVDNVSSSERKALKKEGKKVPYKVLFFKDSGQVNDKNRSIFVEGNKKGDSHNMTEVHLDPETKSMLPTNNTDIAKHTGTEEMTVDQAGEERARAYQEFIDSQGHMEQMTNNTQTGRSYTIDYYMRDFLESVGVSYESVETIYDRRGRETDHIAQADMINKVVRVVEEKADISTLPEEASHWFVELLGRDHPAYKAMMREIVNYNIYDEVKEEYSHLNEDQVMREAIGKLIALHIVDKVNGTNYAAQSERRTSQLNRWWDILWRNVKRIFSNKDHFAQSALDVLNKNIDGLRTKEEVADEIYEQAYNNSRRLAIQDEVARARSEDQTAKQSTAYPENARREINYVSEVPVESVEEAQDALLRDFEKYFPQYADFSQEERENFVSLMAEGHIDIYC